MVRPLMLLWLLLVTVARLSAQKAEGLSAMRVLSSTVSVRAWTVEQGLPQSSVIELGSDSRGYLWGATFGGLFRFDGRSVVPFSASEVPAISTNSVTALHVAGDDVWVGTPGGTIARLRDGRFVDSLPTLPHDQANIAIDNILITRPGEFWVREGDQVEHAVNGRWVDGPRFRSTSNFVTDRSGNVLYHGPDGLIRVTPQGDASQIANPTNGPQENPSALHLDAADRVWLGLTSGLWSYYRGAVRQLHRSKDAVVAVVTDSSGNVWFSDGPRLFRLRVDGPTGTAMAEPVLDAGTLITTLATLHDGLLAIGTLEGLLVLRLNPSRIITDERLTPAPEVGSLASLGDGTVFLTSRCSDVIQTDGGTRVVRRIARPDTLGCTRSLLIDRRQRLWMGGDGAIRRTGARRDRDPSRDTVFALTRFLDEPPEVRALLERGDTVFFGLSDGRLGRIGPDDRLTFVPGFTIPTDVPVHSLASDTLGNLWVAQVGMVTRLRRNDVAIFHRLHGVPNAVPRTLMADQRGGVWVGTYGSGLWHLNPSSTPRTRAVPLPDRTVSSMTMDARGRWWMSGNRGISIVQRSALDEWLADSSEVPGVRLLQVADGVPEGNNGRPAAVRIAPGRLAFSSVKGLVEIDEDVVVTSGVTPPVRIDSIVTNTGRALVTDSVLQLELDERTLQIGVSVPTYRFAEAVRLRYRLIGRDDGWINLGDVRELRLVSLAPGAYRLLVEARVPGGAWRAAPPLAFTVIPHFVELWWPPVLAAAVVVVLTVLLLLLRVRATRATARALEVELRARREAAESTARHQRELAQVGRVAVAGELTASLSHELGQPLAAIVNNAEVARRLLARHAGHGNALQQSVEEALLDVVAQGRRASQVVREFRRFLRREHGERETVRLSELFESVTVLLRHEFEQRDVRLTVRVNDDVPVLVVERVLFQQVFVNLLQNACEAAGRNRKGLVLVRARRVGDGVRVSVVDDGPGFAADVRRSAFEPFVTTRRDGMGMGLAIVRRVVDAQGGHIAVGHLPGAGAVVSLWLPARHVPTDTSDSLVPSQVTTHA